MPTEKILIQNFAGIREMEIEVKKINVLIGPQASGKSVVAKLLYYFKSIFDQLPQSPYRITGDEQLKEYLINSSADYFFVESSDASNFRIRYELECDFVEIKMGGSELEIDYSDVYIDILEVKKEATKKVESIIIQKGKRFSSPAFYDPHIESHKIVLSYLKNRIDKRSAFFQQFIPAGRSLFSVLKDNLFSIISGGSGLDLFIAEFGKYYENLVYSFSLRNKKNFREDKKQELNEFRILCQMVLKGQYSRIEDEDFLVMDDNRKIPLSMCSSGQQEFLPIFLILEELLLDESDEGETVYIEEPEAHLFPGSQKAVVELTSLVYNSKRDNLQFFITTHSPYILTAFNNLLQAGTLAKDASSETLEKIKEVVPESRFLYPGEVAAYSLSNGECISIIDAETGLIDAAMIDSVSEELAVQFDDLLEID